MFRRQPLARPPTISLGLIPAHVCDRAMQFQPNPSIEVSTHPTLFRILPPIDWMLGLLTVPPIPTCGAPEFVAFVSVFSYKRRELGLCCRGARDSKCRNIDGMSPFLVIENKSNVC